MSLLLTRLAFTYRKETKYKLCNQYEMTLKFKKSIVINTLGIMISCFGTPRGLLQNAILLRKNRQPRNIIIVFTLENFSKNFQMRKKNNQARWKIKSNIVFLTALLNLHSKYTIIVENYNYYNLQLSNNRRKIWVQYTR